MKKVNDGMMRYNAIVNSLVTYRDTFQMFTIQEAAKDCGVTEMTVRNFESGKSNNFHLFCYYLNNVLYNFKYNTDEMVRNYNNYVKETYKNESFKVKVDLIHYFSITRKDVIEKYRTLVSKLENMED